MTSDLTALPGYVDFGGKVWLNTAHQGALPIAAAEAAREAVAWKMQPFELTQKRFDETPQKLRAALGRLLNADTQDIVLANSASYGLNLIATAYPWADGDEILVMDGDFPSDLLPWLNVERRSGVKVVRIRPRDRVIAADELIAAITPRTRLLCTTWVHSFSGIACDIDALGAICRDHGIAFIVNGSQAVGARPVDVSALPIDALTGVGFKWLCGPYGTGYCWLSPSLRERLGRTKAYWLSMLTAADLAKDLGELSVGPPRTAADYDIFGTANFFNFTAFTAALEHVLSLGQTNIAAHDQALVQRFIDGIEGSAFRILSPQSDSSRRSTLVFFSHEAPEQNERVLAALRAKGIYVAARSSALRLSPHLYNSSDDIDRALSVLENF